MIRSCNTICVELVPFVPNGKTFKNSSYESVNIHYYSFYSFYNDLWSQMTRVHTTRICTTQNTLICGFKKIFITQVCKYCIKSNSARISHRFWVADFKNLIKFCIRRFLVEIMVSLKTPQSSSMTSHIRWRWHFFEASDGLTIPRPRSTVSV